jgi:cellulose synthase/poly-beta-1,6-N-acetylglucosamine synthase-like glycosyltransferase/peptidoglycan/xylan/chitin deacetylase (PgdA/CDA1 family)
MEEGEVLDILQTPESGNIFTEYDTKQDIISDETYLQLPFPYVIRKYGKAADSTVILTFDDGPDPKYTPEILDILKAEHVPASFFMVGQNMESNIPLVRRIYNEGYEIGNHTFTHPNLADVTRERAKLEMNATRRLMEILTGHSTVMFRPPFNADAEPQDLQEIIPVEESRKENYITIGESVDPQDWDVTGQLNPPINADSIFNRIVRYQSLGSVILLHDAGGNRSQTVKALPMIIHYFKNKHYHFGTIAQLLGKSRDDLMPPVTNPKEKLLNNASFLVADSIFFVEHFIYGLFFVGIFLSIGRMIFMGVLATIQNNKAKRLQLKSKATPLVSVIVPAYNENVNAVNTVANLLKSDYPDFEIIFVNDGSKDNTFELVRDAFSGNPKVKVFDKPNGGKASALNLGIEKANGRFVVCIDADTQLKANAISKLMESFIDDDTGAVAGNVKVGNPINMLTQWQSIEYITAQNFDRKAFDILNCITVVPGAIGAFRKEAIEDAGGFTTDTLAEDCDLTIRILRSGYTVRTNSEAIAMTEAPEKMDQFLRQRFRWSFGVMQTFYKHRDACFNPQYKGLGLVALPNILVFQILLPMFSPLADLLMLAGLFTGNAERIGFYYLIFQLVDLAGAIVAFSFERENIAKLWMLIPQRFTYRWLMYYILFKALSKAMKGELQGWGVLKRTGNVKMGNS